VSPLPDPALVLQDFRERGHVFQESVPATRCSGFHDGLRYGLADRLKVGYGGATADQHEVGHCYGRGRLVTAVKGRIKQNQVTASACRHFEVTAQIPGIALQDLGRIFLAKASPGAGACPGIQIEHPDPLPRFAGQHGRVHAKGCLPGAAYLGRSQPLLDTKEFCT
jgi:hypothetical protein